MPEETNMQAPEPTVAPAQSSTASDSKTNAILAWVFAPITSFVWKDSPDAFVRAHARESLNFGIANVVLWLVLWVVSVVYNIIIGNLLYSSFTLFGLASLLSCVWSLLWLAFWIGSVVIRIMGAVKASNGQTWTVPYISKFMSKYIKL